MAFEDDDGPATSSPSTLYVSMPKDSFNVYEWIWISGAENTGTATWSSDFQAVVLDGIKLQFPGGVGTQMILFGSVACPGH